MFEKSYLQALKNFVRACFNKTYCSLTKPKLGAFVPRNNLGILALLRGVAYTLLYFVKNS